MSKHPLKGHMTEIVNEFTVKKDGSETIRRESIVPAKQNVKKEVVQAKKVENNQQEQAKKEVTQTVKAENSQQEQFKKAVSEAVKAENTQQKKVEKKAEQKVEKKVE